MIRASTWFVIAGQLSLWVGISLCYLLTPGPVHATEHGVSNYGVYKPTATLYTITFLLVALCTLLASYITVRQSRHLAVLLHTIAMLYVVVLISTYVYRHSHALRDIHILSTSVLYLVQFLASLWLVWQLRTNPVIIALFFIQIAGSILSLISLLEVVPLLLIGQAITTAGSGLLLIILVHHVTTSH